MVVLVSICRCPLTHASQLHRFVHCDLFPAIPSTSLHRFDVKTFERKLICWYRAWQQRGFCFWTTEKVQSQCLALSVPPCHFLSFLFPQMILPVDGCWLSAGSYSLRLYCQLFFHMLCLGSFCLLWRFCQGVQSVQSVWRSFRFEFCLHIWSFTPRPHTKRHHVICACEYFPVFMSAPKQESLWLNRLSPPSSSVGRDWASIHNTWWSLTRWQAWQTHSGGMSNFEQTRIWNISSSVHPSRKIFKTKRL